MDIAAAVRDYSRRRPTRKSPDEPIKQWRETESIGGTKYDVRAVVLSSPGCFWFNNSGCTYCGYFNDIRPDVTDDNHWNQFNAIDHENAQIVKLYTSGSFLDQREVSQKSQIRILESLTEKEMVVIETRTEFCTEKVLEPLSQFKNVQLALGLEIADDDLLARCVNKGNDTGSYLKAVEVAAKYDFSIRTYLLCKPILMNEVEALESAVKSIEFSAPHSEVISLNPLYVHKNTLTEYLFKRGEYYPPRLWTLVEILRRTSHLTEQCRIICDPTAGGSKRGAHNCGKCDKFVQNAIENYSHHQDPKVLDEVIEHGCECLDRYRIELALEPYSFVAGGLLH